MSVPLTSTSYTADLNLRFRLLAMKRRFTLLNTLPSGNINQSGAHWETSAESFSDPLNLLPSTNVLRLVLDAYCRHNLTNSLRLFVGSEVVNSISHKPTSWLHYGS